MRVYFISGLGADERAFRYIRLPNTEKRFIRWISPEKKEPIRKYAIRLLDQIDSKEPTILIGLSFGGIVAQELASIIPCEQLILISSVKHPRELSPILRFVRRSRLYRLLPFGWVKPVLRQIAPYWLGALSERHRALLKVTINETDNVFAEWAIEALMRWEGNSLQIPTIHLQGACDRIFPLRYIDKSIAIDGAGHFMVVTHAKLINQLLQKHLNPQSI